MSIMNGSNWIETIDEDYLDNIKTEPVGNRHVPINHGFALRLFRRKLKESEIMIKKEYGFLSPESKSAPLGLKYMYAVETYHSFGAGYFTLGFVNFNDGKRSFVGLAGERVTVCSNEMVTGLIIESKRKHTKNAKMDLSEKIDAVVDRFHGYTQSRMSEIKNMQNTTLGKVGLGCIVLNLHRQTQIAPSTVGQIIQEYDNPQFDYGCGGKSLWDLLNACTTVFKKYNNPLYYIEHCQQVSQVLGEYLNKSISP